MILLVVGLLLNYPVAWGLLLLGRWVQPELTNVRVDAARWPGWVTERPPESACGREMWMENWYTTVRMWQDNFDDFRFPGDIGDDLLAAQEGVQGWPFRSMRWRSKVISETLTKSRREIITGWELPGKRTHGLNVLGLCPVWPGFVLNGVVYAAVLGVGIALPRRMRGWWRSRRGLCRECGYPRGGEICPECGVKRVG